MERHAMTSPELKAREKEILEYVADVCEKHRLVYFLEAGTLLGAVRHKGFIPWDDDVDIAMPRGDYNRLIRILEHDPSFPSCSHKNDPGYILPFAKVHDPSTEVEWLVDTPQKANYGVWIDIFPLDVLPDARFPRLFHQLKMKVFYSLWWHAAYPYKDQGVRRAEVLRRLGRLRPLLSHVHRLTKTAKECDRLTGQRDLANHFGLNDQFFSFPKEWFAECVPVEFEGRMYPAPKGYHEDLTACYGDYMQLPPEEMRVAEHAMRAYEK